MSKMSDLWIEIQELLEDGADPLFIAEKLQVPVDWIESVAESCDITQAKSVVGQSEKDC